MKSCESSVEADDGVWFNPTTMQITYPDGHGHIEHFDRFPLRAGRRPFGLIAQNPQGTFNVWFWDMPEEDEVPDGFLLPLQGEEE